MGAVRNETGDFPVCDAKPSKFIGETTFAHLLRAFPTAPALEETREPNERAGTTGPGDPTGKRDPSAMLDGHSPST